MNNPFKTGFEFTLGAITAIWATAVFTGAVIKFFSV